MFCQRNIRNKKNYFDEIFNNLIKFFKEIKEYLKNKDFYKFEIKCMRHHEIINAEKCVRHQKKLNFLTYLAKPRGWS